MQYNLIQIALGFIFSIMIAFVSYRFRVLSLSGALGAIIVGTIIFGLGGMAFAVPLLLFFISSSMLSRLTNYHKRQSQFVLGKFGPRDIWQVFANGGTAVVFAIAFSIKGNFVWFIPYLASLCESAADTWATEIGTLSKSPPIFLRTFKPVETGQSGAISLLGCLGAIAGALAIMSITYILNGLTKTTPYFPISIWLVCALAGIFGAIFDSIFGATIQTIYKCQICQKATESKSHCGQSSVRARGLVFMNNDLVNFVSSFLAAILSIWLIID